MASIESTWTSRPSRMIATRSQVRSTSSMMCDDRKMVRPSSRASRTSPKNVCWTSGSRPDVGSSRMSRSGRCWSATTSPTFCLLPFEYSLNRRLGSRSSALDELRDVRLVDAAAQVAEVGDRLGAGQPVVQVELAGQVADPSVDRDRIGGRLDAEHLGASRCRPDEVEQDAHRRRLAGAVRPEEAEDLALGDLEVELDDAAMLAVGLGQALGLMTAVIALPFRDRHYPDRVSASRARGAPRRRDRRRNGSDRSVSATATAVVSGTASDDPDAADDGAHDLDRDDLRRRRQERVLATGGEQHDERQRRADVGEDEGVDRRRDVRPADVHRPLRQHDARRATGSASWSSATVAAWVTVTSSRMPSAPKMIAGQEQAADVDVRQADRLEVGRRPPSRGTS